MYARLDDWLGYLERLREARYSGFRAVRDASGDEITFKSDAELSAALAAVEAEIRRYQTNPPNTIVFATSKGI